MLSTKGFQNKNENSLTTSKTTLNPNAAEFVPFSSKSSPANAKNVKVSNLDVPISSGKAILVHSDSNVSNNSDDEDLQYWRRQLPDDITPDFGFMGGDELQMVSGLSINDRINESQFDVLGTNHLPPKQNALSIHGVDDINLSWSMLYNGDRSSVPFTSLSSTSSLWNKQVGNANLTSEREDIHHKGDSDAGSLNYLANEYSPMNNASFSPIEFLSAEFPGFSVECIEEVFYRNGCDINLTVEILSQLEVQIDGSLTQNLNSRIAALDFHALPVSKANQTISKCDENGFFKCDEKNVKQTSGTFQHIIDKGSFPFTTKHGTSGASRDALNYASTLCKFASLDSSHWKYDKNGSSDMNVGSSRSLQSLSNSYSGHGKSMYTDKPQGNSSIAQAATIWPETGDAVGNVFSESKDEAHDLAHIRNACFEQAREACRLGNMDLANELSIKGHLFNMQIEATHEKIRENIFRRRNHLAVEAQSHRRQGQDPLIDLHSLHVSEAIRVLKHELNILRRTARSAGQLLQVMVYVGTGHDTKGSNTPARLLLVAVEQCLLDEELQFSQPQPGLLRVVLF